MANLYTDDDAQRGIDSLPRQMDHPLDHHRWWIVSTVLDAVLPAYRKRLLNELADEYEKIPRVLGLRPETSGWLRSKAKEE